MIELATSAGSGRIFHLLSGAGSTSEIVGIRVDNDNSSGFTFSLAGQRLTFSAITGTTGITNCTTYYVAGTVTANVFQVATSLGGARSLVLQSGNTNASKIRQSVVSGGTQETHYVYSTPRPMASERHCSASNSFKIQQGNTAAIGPEPMVTLIELKNTNAIGFYGATPVTRAAAIASPTAPSAAYVQAEAQAVKTAIDAIRTALTNIGITA